MKYIIELEDEPMIANSFNHEVDELWKAKGFNSLVFDQNGIKKLTPYTEPDRNAIEDEVWDFARRIICPSDCCEDSISKYTEKFLGIPSHKTRAIFKDLSYQEAKARYEEWKMQKDEIHVGDELFNRLGIAYVIYHIDRDKRVAYGINVTRGYPLSQETFPIHKCYTPNKTSRHFPEVVELLKKMEKES